MRYRKAGPALASLAIGGALVLGGCGGGDDSATSAEPAKAMHDDAMKGDGSTKHGDSMKSDDSTKHDGEHAMKDDNAMHDETDDHGGAMKDG